MSAPLLEMQHITKRYGDFVANDRVNFSLHHKEIHALLGENGAGKTTLMRILGGFTQPDAGEIRVEGQKVRIRGPQDALRLGIGMVHQHWRLVESFTVLENLMLGSSIGDRRKLHRQIAEISERFGLKISPDAGVASLSLGERQRVEILRVVQRGARILVLDEPTAVLSPQESDRLFEILYEMVEGGSSIVFISHKMKEVMRHCDRITVMRRGRVTGEREGESATASDLVQLTVGRPLDQSARPVRRSSIGSSVLELHQIQASSTNGKVALRGVSLALRAGEILGVAGVSGNGQTELAEICTGILKPTSGFVALNNYPIAKLSIGDVNRAGISFVPEDRLKTGVCPDLSVAENLIAREPERRPYSRFGIIDWPAVYDLAIQDSVRFDIRMPGPRVPIRWLSGGNVQKVVLAREFATAPKVLIAAQPTRGLDVGATEFVHAKLESMRDQGGAILLISDDLDEILKLSDRLVVLYDGKIEHEFGPDASRERIGLAMLGIRDLDQLPAVQ